MRAYRPIRCHRTEYRDGALYLYCRGNLILEAHGDESGKNLYSGRCVLCGRTPYRWLDKTAGDLHRQGVPFEAIRRVARGATLFLWRVVEVKTRVVSESEPDEIPRKAA